ALFSSEENRAAGTYSATTAIAAMLTFALGAYALVGDMRIAAAAAVAAAGIPATREAIHGLVEKITWPELRSGLVLLAMTCIALPILKDDPIGPFGGVNPREVWIIAILLAGISFLGYLAVKVLGVSRGVLLAAAAGGVGLIDGGHAHQCAARCSGRGCTQPPGGGRCGGHRGVLSPRVRHRHGNPAEAHPSPSPRHCRRHPCRSGRGARLGIPGAARRAARASRKFSQPFRVLVGRRFRP